MRTRFHRLLLPMGALLLLAVFSSQGMAQGRGSSSVIPRFLLHKSLDETHQNDLNDHIDWRYKSEAKLKRLLSEEQKGLGLFGKKKNKSSNGMWGNGAWKKKSKGRKRQGGDARLQDLSLTGEGTLPEAVRMTPNRLRDARRRTDKKQRVPGKRRNKMYFKKKAALEAKIARQQSKLKSLGKNYSDKALWKFLNRREKMESRRRNSTP